MNQDCLASMGWPHVGHIENGQKSGMDFPQKGQQVMSPAMPGGVINLTRQSLSEALTRCPAVSTRVEPRPGKESMVNGSR